MAWRTEKIDKEHEDLVWSGAEQGIAPSPHKGTANLQNVNIQTETKEVMCSFGRVNDLPSYSGSIIVATSGDGASTFTITGLSSFIPVGTPISVGSGSNLTPGNYYINSVTGTTGSQIVTLTLTYNGPGITPTAGGYTAPFTTITLSSASVDYVTEEYFDGTILQYRYFLLESAGYVWVLDTGATWSTYGWTPINLDEQRSGASGIGLVNGWIHVFVGDDVWVKMTCALGIDFGNVVDFLLQIPAIGAYQNPHKCFTSKNNTMYICNGNRICSVLPGSATSTAVINTFSYGSLTFSGSTITITTLYGGSPPVIGQTMTFLSSGTSPTNMSPTAIYYVIASNPVLGTFSYATSVGGSAVTPSGGSGTFFFNSYSPRITSSSNNYTNTITFALNNSAFTLVPSEIIQCMTEISNTFIIGTQGTSIYLWGGLNPSWDGLIPLPEANTVQLLTVNNMGYAFTGNKGNIYITNGSAASPALTVPDYCAGIPGTPSSYIEPYFVWGGVAWMRGRVYFSIQDQTPNKTGNCGGIWSFIPTENLYIGQDTGLALRMENTNSYGNLNGLANVIIPNQNQAAIGTQYFTGWSSSIGTIGGGAVYYNTNTLSIPSNSVLGINVGAEVTFGSGITGLTAGNYYIVNVTSGSGGISDVLRIQISATKGGTLVSGFTGGASGFDVYPIYSIDTSGTYPTTTAIIETDIAATGTMLNKRTFAQQEYKLASPLLSGESVQLYYRLNLTDAWTSCGTVVAESNSLSGYFTSTFQNTQWLQIQAQLIPNSTSTFSGNRITELRVR